ncbi:MAG: cobalt ECF transporter T component CbiQ [Pseudonocardia sp.]
MFVPRDSPVHRLPATPKVVALLVVVVAVVATPREAFWAFGAYALLLVAVLAASRIPPAVVGRRMLVELPFVVFAVLLPFVATGDRVDVLGLSLSRPGLLGGWNVLAKGTLGVVASILLAATTPARALLAALQRLRVPPLLVEIGSFMVRYVDVVADELRRMRIARDSRGFEARHLGSLPVLARVAGTLFIRAYERGERVHLAMLSRGYTGAMPALSVQPEPPAAWALAAVPAVLAVGVAVSAAVTT